MKDIWTNIKIATKLVFKHTPINALIYLLVAITSAIFSPFQIFATEKVVNSVSLMFELSNNKNLYILLIWSILLILSFVLSCLYDYLRPYLSLRMYKNLMVKITPDILETIKNVEYYHFENIDSMNTIYRVTNAPYALVQNQFNSIVNGIYFLLSSLGIVFMFYRINSYLGVISVVCSISLIVIQYQIEKKKNQLEDKQTLKKRKLEYLSNLFLNKYTQYEIRIFKAQKFIVGKWENNYNEIHRENISHFKSYSKLYFLKILITILFLLISMGTIFYIFSLQIITYGKLFSFFTNIQRLLNLLSTSTDTIQNIVQKSYNMNFYRKFLNIAKKNTIEEAKNMEDSKYDIVFDNVTFKYPGTNDIILNNISFKVNKKQKISIVGKNGAGKSTVLKLICGLYLPNEGNIYIQGINTKNLNLNQIGMYLAVMFQDYQRYQLSIRENIAFGDIKVINKDNILFNALHIANSDIWRKYELDQILGHIYDGIDLSGGEWQKVVLSRMFLAQQPVVLLDEPTSAIDPISESKMYNSIKEIIDGKTAVIISHRLITAKQADIILVFENGKIIEKGSHKKLTSKDTYYKKMYDTQQEWYI